jgi:hypothetical protein
LRRPAARSHVYSLLSAAKFALSLRQRRSRPDFHSQDQPARAVMRQDKAQSQDRRLRASG